jgi:hypothetical protein
VVKRKWLGLGAPIIDDATGEPVMQSKRIFTGTNAFVEVDDVPVFWLPYIQGDPNDPLGPFRSVTFGFNQMYGFQIGAVFNLYGLFGLDPIQNTTWHGSIDYMSYRGPAIGSTYNYTGKNLFGIPGAYLGTVQAWGLYDKGFDVLGGNRGAFDNHPSWRGRFLLRHQQELGEDWFFQTQFSALSDQNFMEEFYWNEFNTSINQETFLYLKNQQGNLAFTSTFEPNLRNWVNEGEKLPEVRGYGIGLSPFDFLTYNVRGSMGYDRLRVSDTAPPNTGLTSFADSTGRFDLWQEVYAPFYLGPVKVMPYGVVDLGDYTSDLFGQQRGRVYAGGGVRASIPFTRIYPDVQSELLNLNAINHKLVLSANYYKAWTDSHFWLFPQIDRLNDDATDQSVRDMANMQTIINPLSPQNINNNLLYDPQIYAIRKLMALTSFNYIDTVDSVDVLELDLRQRLQTKRGYPGMQHIVDWMTLDTSASYFPESTANNFGKPFAFLQYNWTWNVGDRTALVSDGWYDPFENGAHWTTIGAYLNRPDRTTFYMGYRQTDPINSRLLVASATYVISPKYAVTGNASYDFGLASGIGNGITFTRMGSDAIMSIGLSYNAILNTFNFSFTILPNVAAAKGAQAIGFSPNALAGR